MPIVGHTAVYFVYANVISYFIPYFLLRITLVDFYIGK